MRSILRSALARIFSFVPIAIATLLTSRIILGHYGIRAFDSYALMLSLIFLIPLNNLGVGAAVIAAYAGDGPETERSWRVTLTATRALTVSTAATIVVSMGLGVFGGWPTLLGHAAGPTLFVGIAMSIFALTFVPGLATSMLLGVHRNHVSVLIQTAFAPIILVLVLVLTVFAADPRWLIVVPSLAMAVVSLVTAMAAQRSTKITWAGLLRAVPNRRKYPGASVRQLSGPFLLSAIATPIALQSDRVVLSHVSDARALAQYSVMMQIVAPALSLIAASAQPLWPIFTSARARGVKGPSIVRTVALFSIVAAMLGAVLVVLANPVARLISGDRIHFGLLIPISAALMLVSTAMSYPLSMNLMTPKGVRFVAYTCIIALPLNVGLSIVLARSLDAAGPLLATVAVGLLVQAVPGLIYSRRTEHPARHRLDSDRVEASDLLIFDGQPVAVDKVI